MTLNRVKFQKYFKSSMNLFKLVLVCLVRFDKFHNVAIPLLNVLHSMIQSVKVDTIETFLDHDSVGKITPFKD